MNSNNRFGNSIDANHRVSSDKDLEMIQRLWQQGCWVMASLIGFASLAVALYLQHVHGWQPCPLCIAQRVALLGLSLLALALGLTTSVRQRSLSPSHMLVIAVIGLAFVGLGLGTAGYHGWVLYNPAPGCGVDPLEAWINSRWLVQQLPWLLQADGLCTTPYPPVLGLHLPFWTLVLVIAQAVLLGRWWQLVWRYRSQSSSQGQTT